MGKVINKSSNKILIVHGQVARPGETIEVEFKKIPKACIERSEFEVFNDSGKLVEKAKAVPEVRTGVLRINGEIGVPKKKKVKITKVKITKKGSKN